MKQGRSLVTLVMVVFALVLCVYFGFYVFDTFNEPYTTAYTYQYTYYDSAQANGLLIRTEQVLSGQEGVVELQCAEGEKVAVNQTVALVYRDAQARQDRAALEALEEEIAVLESVMTVGTGVDSAARLDEDILQSVVELRFAAAGQEFSELDEQVREVKSTVLRRSFTYGEGVTAAELKQRLKQLREEYSARSSQLAGTYSRVRAKNSGTFSALVDGLETALTPEMVKTLTPAALRDYLSAPTGHVDAVGKLILGNRWYFAANLPAEVAGQMKNGGTALLRFTGEFNRDVEMRVDYVSEIEGDEACVVFSTDRYLGQTTLLRSQSAELIFNSYSGLRIPKQALHMEKYTNTNEETGEETVTQQLGVYALVGGKAEFKPVSVVAESEDFYVVSGTNAAAADTLRAGDEIVVRATGLYDGKIMEA